MFALLTEPGCIISVQDKALDQLIGTENFYFILQSGYYFDGCIVRPCHGVPVPCCIKYVDVGEDWDFCHDNCFLDTCEVVEGKGNLLQIGNAEDAAEICRCQCQKDDFLWRNFAEDPCNPTTRREPLFK